MQVITTAAAAVADTSNRIAKLTFPIVEMVGRVG